MNTSSAAPSLDVDVDAAIHRLAEIEAQIALLEQEYEELVATLPDKDPNDG